MPCCLLRFALVSLILVKYASPAENPLSLGAQWCHHLRSTPEPDVIIYPRIPKSGSSTIQSLVDQLLVLNNSTFHWETPTQFWIDLDKDPDLKHSFITQIKQYRDNYRKPVIVDGHFKQTLFEPHDLHARRVEYISLARECGPRLQSHFFYDLYDGSIATLARAEGKEAERAQVNAYKSRHQSLFLRLCMHNGSEKKYRNRQPNESAQFQHVYSQWHNRENKRVYLHAGMCISYHTERNREPLCKRKSARERRFPSQ